LIVGGTLYLYENIVLLNIIKAATKIQIKSKCISNCL
jgi:hypothetical protein